MIAVIAAATPLMVNPVSSRATGAAAHYVAVLCDEGREHLRSSVYFGLDASGVFNTLCGVYEECRVENWDGYGAEPVAEDTYRNAYQLLESLPWGTPAPSVGAEPDGQLTLEWHRSPRRTLSVSVSPDGDLHYAALLGVSKAYGSEPFFGETPKAILDLISRVCAA